MACVVDFCMFTHMCFLITPSVAISEIPHLSESLYFFRSYGAYSNPTPLFFRVKIWGFSPETGVLRSKSTSNTLWNDDELMPIHLTLKSMPLPFACITSMQIAVIFVVLITHWYGNPLGISLNWIEFLFNDALDTRKVISASIKSSFFSISFILPSFNHSQFSSLFS